MPQLAFRPIVLALTLLAVPACSKSTKGPTAPPQGADLVVTGMPLGVAFSVDGAVAGTTPKQVPGLSAGSHTFIFAGFAGYADSTVVVSSAVDSLKVNLRPLIGTPTAIQAWPMPFAGGSLPDTPYAVDATQAGDVWVAGSSGTIYRFSVEGLLLSQWTTTGMGGSGDMAASSSHVVYASSISKAVGLYTAAGALVRYLQATPTNALGEWQPIPQPAIDQFATMSTVTQNSPGVVIENSPPR